MHKLVLLLAIIGTLAIGGVAYYKFSNKEQLPVVQYNRSEHILQRIKVIKADEYDLTVVDGRHMHAYLQTKAIPSAYKDVIRLINTADYAKAIVMDENNQGDLVVDIVLTFKQSQVRSSELSLTAWLKHKKLLWEKP